MLQAAEEDSLEYIPWDFKYFAKLRGNQILEDMQPVIRKSLDATGMFVCPPSSPSPEAKRNTVSSWVRYLSRYSDRGAPKYKPALSAHGRHMPVTVLLIPFGCCTSTDTYALEERRWHSIIFVGIFQKMQPYSSSRQGLAEQAQASDTGTG